MKEDSGDNRLIQVHLEKWPLKQCMQACMCYSQSGIPHLLFVVGMWKCPWSKAHTFISTSQVSGFCWCRGGQCHLKSRCQAHREIAVDTISDPQFYARYLSCRNQNKKKSMCYSKRNQSGTSNYRQNILKRIEE